MPPKAKAAAPSKKTEQKKKEKVIEDKTFGLKNKKGAKQQKFIQQVEKQVKFGGNPSSRKLEEAKKLEKEKKDAKLKEAKELNMILKPVQKVEKGIDPKSVLCAFFKQGQCAKGDKCKFSHDLTLERKAEKRSMYHDMRDSEETMEDWDEEKLKEVVAKKQAEDDKRPTTDIICRYFVDAVEKSKYGWFWECPNGGKCIYRHALPPGFVLKKDKKKDDKKDEISIEDLIERERSSLGSNLTKVTLETFIAWKKRKILEKEESARKEEEKKRTDYRAGRQIGLSGREMFTFNPEMAAADQYEDGDDAFDTGNLPDDEEIEENIEYREIVLDSIVSEAQEADGSGTKAAEDRLKVAPTEHSASNGLDESGSLQNGVRNEAGKDSGASVRDRKGKGDSDDESNGDSEDGSDSADVAGGGVGVPIDENLFLDEDLGDGLDDFELNL